MTDNPWLIIPAVDYEGHMAEIGQTAALRDVFASLYAIVRPRRLLVLGCTTGGDFALVDPTVTDKSVGVDVNPEYLEIARERLGHLGGSIELVRADVLAAGLPASSFDLVHASLILEYVDAGALFLRIREWMTPAGVCSTITQNPAQNVGAVTPTAHRSLQSLDGRMRLYSAGEIESHAAGAGLECIEQRDLPLPGGKSFTVSIFRRAAGEHS